MISVIVSIIFFLSFVALTVIVLKKIPLLLNLPETEPAKLNWKEMSVKIKDSVFSDKFSFEILLQKILSRIRVLTLKTDHKTSSWLQKLRQRDQKKKFDEGDNYWQEIKNHTRK